MKNNFSLAIATVNGSGSQSANNILAKTLFRMGYAVGAKNLFPSNIAGLSTWFNIRVDENGFCGRKLTHEIFVAKNSATLETDLQSIETNGFLFYDADFKNLPPNIRPDIVPISIPYRELTQSLSSSVKMRKLISNMVYVGALAQLLKLDVKILNTVIRDQFQNKDSVIEPNLKAIEAGMKYAEEHLKNINFPYRADSVSDNNKDKILVDGNSAAALGAVAGGCTVMAWYPITPSSSLAENFHAFSSALRENENNENNFAVVQAEDELSAINMVIGAGWAGARAMTPTSGPGLSLMAEAAGLSYFAEIPAVIWDVQRAGPSTGLPTRTMQGDLQFAAHLSHGDTEHIVLLPANPKECFEFARMALDLAEEFQTLVIVLTDLDIGMNFSISENLKVQDSPYERGKVLTAEKLNSENNFARYRDVDGDGICYRTLPGTMHTNAAYFTRGTGHNEDSSYTEDSEVFERLLIRLKKKLLAAASKVPQPLLPAHKSKSLIVAYGSSDFVMPELLALLDKVGAPADYLRICALPLSIELEKTLAQYEKIYIVEQNRDGQMRNLMAQKYASHSSKFISILSFDGLPLSAETLLTKITSSPSHAEIL